MEIGKNTLIIIVIIVLVGIGVWWMAGEAEKPDGTELKKEGCIQVNREKFQAYDDQHTNTWIEDQKIYAKYYSNVPNKKATQMIIVGFFKGINVMVSLSAAKFFKKELDAHMKSANALPVWEMAVGELACN